ncbi:hypothetical protein N7462_003249 [Penicillium macrosclerotiorum]|uniref:uncharacterized protein n=1 Tax=Penicillium macrosclerotiorum TaxID=303699 RepID=UPI0025488E43|nr:uncharacterized protein N7462_003249 [Penicillium macrosclerotiorum]KAJ5688857.1 hypothetical protein N7462_003249 [Penicillium macrosclerotiorum]
MVIFWGSQSGRAEMLARRVAKSLRDRFNIQALAADLSDYDHLHLVELQKNTPCGFILSTYGDGEPPDNTNGLWTSLEKFEKSGTKLENLRYIIFGLGNSKYRLFNRVADHVDLTLQRLGAVRYGSAGRGDDANGDTENAFLKWRPGCEEILKNELNLHEQKAVYRPAFLIPSHHGLLFHFSTCELGLCR